MKLYIIVRKDLTIAQRAVQAGHAVAEFCLHSPFSRWTNGTLIYLGVKGLPQLKRLKYKLKDEGIRYIEFKEPDLDNQITAVATDQHSKIFEKLNLL